MAFLQKPALYVDVLAHLGENDGNARVLAIGHALGGRQGRILGDLVEHHEAEG